MAKKGKSFAQFVDSHEDKSVVLSMRRQLAAVARERAEVRIEIGPKSPPWRCGVLSCTHLGSIYEEIGVLNAVYDWFAQEGIRTALHCGDMTEGSAMRKGHEYSIHKHGYDQQLKWAAKQYPRRPGITTHLISGNHDASHVKNGGADICAGIAAARDDIVYLGPDQARIVIDRPGERNISVDMLHPDGGVSYALSYKPQKIIESIEAGNKPDLLLVGHFHKAFTLPAYRGVACVLAGTTQRQTDFMARNGLAAHIGAHIIEMRNLDGQVIVSSTWRAFYP